MYYRLYLLTARGPWIWKIGTASMECLLNLREVEVKMEFFRHTYIYT